MLVGRGGEEDDDNDDDDLDDPDDDAFKEESRDDAPGRGAEGGMGWSRDREGPALSRSGGSRRPMLLHPRPSFPVQARYQFGQPKRAILTAAVPAPFPLRDHEVIGHPSLRLHRMRLPPPLLPLLDTVVQGCEQHASTLPTGWQTDLYSLTKQDIALREVPHIYNAARPVVVYLRRAIARVYGTTPSRIRMDRNQPHVLKYCCRSSNAEDRGDASDGGDAGHERCGRGHTGVELHHDKCDYTANLMLSRAEDYAAGGTYFPDADRVVRLGFGEFLLHPGGLVHSGVNITAGSRYLMVIFAHEK